MSRYKGRNLPDGKIQILQDGKEFAVVNNIEDAKALIMRLETPPVPIPPLPMTSPAGLKKKGLFDATPYFIVGLVVFLSAGVIIALAVPRGAKENLVFVKEEAPKQKEILKENVKEKIEEPKKEEPKKEQKIPVADKDEIKIKSFDLDITATTFRRHVSIDKNGKGETVLRFDLNVRNGSETKVENFLIGVSDGRWETSGAWVSFEDEFGNKIEVWPDELNGRFRNTNVPWKISPGDLKTRVMYTEGAILKAKKLKGTLGFYSTKVPFIVELELLPKSQKK